MSTANLLTPQEAHCVARDLLGQSLNGDWPGTTVNMASASLTPEGAVLVHLLGMTERHPSMSDFLRTYGI